MNYGRFFRAIFTLTCLCFTASGSAQTETYDVVFQKARVIDPETRLDAVRYVAVNGNKIAAVSEKPLDGKIKINAEGLVLGPGFVDLHTHSISTPSMWMVLRIRLLMQRQGLISLSLIGQNY